ncbi:MAG TPA: PIN domain-containing protein [Streptosporangiaceae bacterium]
MAFIVIYDANVLYPNTLRDLLIRIAQVPYLVQAKWTDRIIDEMLEALRKNFPDISDEKAERLRELMNAAVRDCLVSGYEPLIDGLDLPDPDDRHVLAAAIKADAQVIVTWNLKDFPEEKLAPWNMRARSPDKFVLDQIGIDRQAVWACVQQIVDSRTQRPVTTEDVLNQLARDALIRSVASLRAGGE